MRDSLTGLLNHTNILHKLDIELSRARREKLPLSFIMIDIDHFKLINDNYGHPVGDRVLRKLANVLQSRLRKIDSVGRYGGEEFGIILPNANLNDAQKIGENIRKSFYQVEFDANGKKFHVSLSLGLSGFPDINNTTDIVNAADQALYQAKHKGRDNLVIFHPEHIK